MILPVGARSVTRVDDAARRPSVGAPTVAGQGCAYSHGVVPTPEDPACGAPAAVHLLCDAPGWGVVGLDSCVVHAPIARRAGVLLDEHSYEDSCRAGRCWAVA